MSARARLILAAIILLAAGALVYSNTLHAPFIFDDVPTIVDNPEIHSFLPTWTHPIGGPQTTIAGRPIAHLTFAITYWLNGTNVAGYHVGNILIHLLAGLALFGIVRRTLLTSGLREKLGEHATPLALVVALAWTLHPLQTESVTYVVQRVESLMGLFYLLTLYCAIRAMESGGAKWLVGSVVCCALGMGTKEVMVTAPVMVLLYDRTFAAGSFLEALRKRWGFYVALAATWVVLALLMSTAPRSETVGLTSGVSVLDYVQLQIWALVHYLALALCPYPLVLDYGRPGPLPIAQLLPFILILSGVLLATVVALVRWPKWGFLGAWFFVILSPTSSVVPISDPIFEHRVYLSLAGVVAFVVFAIYAAAARGRKSAAPLVMLAVAGIAALGITTWVRNGDYRDSFSIWSDTVRKKPMNANARVNLGIAYMDEKRNPDNGIAEFRKALVIDPLCPEAWYDLGEAKVRQGHYEEAIPDFKTAIRYRPGRAESYNSLGAAYLSLKRFEEAIPCLMKAIELAPEYAPPWINLGNIYLQEGRYPDAESNLRHALKLDPRSAVAHLKLGTLREKQGRMQEALDETKEAVRLDPENPRTHMELVRVLARMGRVDEEVREVRDFVRRQPDFAPGLNHLAWVLATDPDPKVRNGAEAVQAASKACELTKNDDAAMLDTLAAAYAETGRFEEAVKTAKQALDLATAAKQEKLAKDIQEHLKVFESGKPWREVAEIPEP